MTPTAQAPRSRLTPAFIGIIAFKYLKAAAFLLLGRRRAAHRAPAQSLRAPGGRSFSGSLRAHAASCRTSRPSWRPDQPAGAGPRGRVAPDRSRLRGRGNPACRPDLVGDLLHDRADGPRASLPRSSRSRSTRAAFGATCSSRQRRDPDLPLDAAQRVQDACGAGEVDAHDPGIASPATPRPPRGGSRTARACPCRRSCPTRRRCRSARASRRRPALAGFSIGSTYSGIV